MKIHLVSMEDFKKYQNYIDPMKPYIHYQDKELLSRNIEHEAFQNIPVVTKLIDGMEEVDNRFLMEFINNMEASHGIHS